MQLLGCTQAAYCKQLALQPFVANLTSVLETHPDLEKSAMTLHVACHQLVDNGYKLPEALVARYHRCLPPAAALEQMSAERLAQIMAVLSCVPTSAERIGTEQQVAMALLADISKVPKARLVTLLRAAKRSMCHSRVSTMARCARTLGGGGGGGGDHVYIFFHFMIVTWYYVGINCSIYRIVKTLGNVIQ